jgi:hypothetical protein
MFDAETIQSRLREKPFRQVRIVASEGLRYDIYHPDLVLVGKRDMIVGIATPDNPGIYDRATRVAFVHIVALEDLPAPAPLANGPQ